MACNAAVYRNRATGFAVESRRIIIRDIAPNCGNDKLAGNDSGTRRLAKFLWSSERDSGERVESCGGSARFPSESRRQTNKDA